MVETVETIEILERTRLRKDVVARLKAANTAAGDNIFKSRATDIPLAQLPAISVYTLSEVGDGVGNHTPQFNTNLTLQLDVVITATEDDWDDVLDALCKEAVDTLLCNPEFVKEFSRVSSFSTSVQFKDGGDTPVAIATITIGLIYDSVFEPKIEDELQVVHLDVVDANGGKYITTETATEQ